MKGSHKRKRLQPVDIGCPTRNGKKLSNSQACCLAQAVPGCCLVWMVSKKPIIFFSQKNEHEKRQLYGLATTESVDIVGKVEWSDSRKMPRIMIWLLTSAVVDVIRTPQCGRIVTLGSALTPVMLLHHITASARLRGLPYTACGWGGWPTGNGNKLSNCQAWEWVSEWVSECESDIVS